QADLVGQQLLALGQEIVAEQLHQGRHLEGRAAPILLTEGIEGQRLDPEAPRRAHDLPDRARSLLVARGAATAKALRPTAVPVHDDGDVLGQPVKVDEGQGGRSTTGHGEHQDSAKDSGGDGCREGAGKGAGEGAATGAGATDGSWKGRRLGSSVSRGTVRRGPGQKPSNPQGATGTDRGSAGRPQRPGPALTKPAICRKSKPNP